jgi:hypothetical protein
VGADRGQHDDREQDRHAVVPEEGDEAEQEQFAEDDHAAALVEPAAARVGLQEHQGQAGGQGEPEHRPQPLLGNVEDMAAQQDSGHSDVSGAEADVPGPRVGQNADRLGEEESFDAAHAPGTSLASTTAFLHSWLAL